MEAINHYISLARLSFFLRTGLLLPACALFTSREAQAAPQWRRKWDGQLPLKGLLPYDEALEIIYDDSLPRALQPLKDPAAGRVYQECDALILEFKAILKKAKGNLAPYQKRIYEISILVPAGFQALIAWGNRNQTTRKESLIFLRDLLATLSQ